MFQLKEYQEKAVREMKNGCVLVGGTGCGKSITALAYYFFNEGGSLDDGYGHYMPMCDPPRDLYIITTAKKRDSCEWQKDMTHFLIGPDDNYYHKVVVDSWNNIKKYTNVTGAFFIFDEQKIRGTGAWTKAFYRIAKNNGWILLTATPGDKWEDYAPVFIANGFYRNITEFRQNHIIWNEYRHMVMKYMDTKRLQRLWDSISIYVDYKTNAEKHDIDIFCDYDRLAYKELMKTRWNFEEDRPIESAMEFCFELRKIVNVNHTRMDAINRIVREKKRVIIFYNFDYEREILLGLDYEADGGPVEVAEWNGHKHEPIPDSKNWVYLVHYNSCEGWNCILTDTIIFFSQNYSWTILEQAKGRIDRMNTRFTDLYYYHLRSHAPIDNAINKAILEKKNFNKARFIEKCLGK